MSAPANRVHIDRASLTISVASPRELPPVERPELCVVGRSNVGKSSLLNMLLERSKLARTSRTPGRTRLANFFAIQAHLSKQPPVEIDVVDLPGYGYAKLPGDEKRRLAKLLSGYIGDGVRPQAVLLLIDGRHEATASDLEMHQQLQTQGHTVLVAVTKIDRIAKARRAGVAAQLRKALPGAPVVLTSASERIGRDALWDLIWPQLDPPEDAA